MAGSAPSIQVLTSDALFRDITTFASGVPFCVLRFKETEFAAHLAASEDTAAREHSQTPESASRCPLPAQWGYHDARQLADKRPQAPTDLRLWHVAVRRKHKTVIRALAALAKTSAACADNEHIAMAGVVGFAALCCDECEDEDLDTDFLDWVDATCREPHHRRISERQFELLATRTRLGAFIWVHARGFALPPRMVDTAAECGNLRLVRFLHERTSASCTTAAMDGAARNGHLDVVRFLHEQRREGCTTEAIASALRNGHVDVVRFLHERRSEGCSPMAVCLAVIKGRLACVQYAHTHGFQGFGRPVMPYAIMYGHLELVRFLHEHRPDESCSFETLLNAERYEYHAVVDFLCLQRPLRDPTRAFQEAAGQGFLRLALKIAQGAMWSTPAQRYEYAM